jgi:hypothetical protein
MIRIVASVMMLFFGALCSSAFAEDEVVEIGKFAQELQRIENVGGNFRMIWWVPTEYWEESFKQTPMSREQKDAFLNALNDYLVVAIIDGKISPLGSLTPQSAEHVRKNVTVQADDGKSLPPLGDNEIAPEAKNLLLVMKPVFGKMLGEFGKGMELVCFKGKDDTGARLLDPRKKGQLLVTYGGKEYKWRLPLGSLLPPKYDAESGEKFPGNFLFSPYTGAKLTDKAP